MLLDQLLAQAQMPKLKTKLPKLKRLDLERFDKRGDDEYNAAHKALEIEPIDLMDQTLIGGIPTESVMAYVDDETGEMMLDALLDLPVVREVVQRYRQGEADYRDVDSPEYWEMVGAE